MRNLASASLRAVLPARPRRRTAGAPPSACVCRTGPCAMITTVFPCPLRIGSRPGRLSRFCASTGLDRSVRQDAAARLASVPFDGDALLRPAAQAEELPLRTTGKAGRRSAPGRGDGRPRFAAVRVGRSAPGRDTGERPRAVSLRRRSARLSAVRLTSRQSNRYNKMRCGRNRPLRVSGGGPRRARGRRRANAGQSAAAGRDTAAGSQAPALPAFATPACARETGGDGMAAPVNPRLQRVRHWPRARGDARQDRSPIIR